jgi:hypothetical protein
MSYTIFTAIGKQLSTMVSLRSPPDGADHHDFPGNSERGENVVEKWVVWQHGEEAPDQRT